MCEQLFECISFFSMLDLFIVKGENFPELILKSNVCVAVEFLSPSNKIIPFGQTLFVKKSNNPIWDNDCIAPFTIPVFSTKKSEIIFKIYDQKDNKDDYVGKVNFAFNTADENWVNRLFSLNIPCQNNKIVHNATLFIKIQTNFEQLVDIMPFQFGKYAHVYSYYSFKEIQKNMIKPDLSFLIISKIDPSFSKNFKEFNTNDISLNMDPICNKPTLTGNSSLLNFDLNKSAEIHNFLFVPILCSNGYSGDIFINFAFISSNKKKDVRKPQLGATYKINVQKERMLSFPIVFDFDKETKIPKFYHMAAINYEISMSSDQFISKISNNALYSVLSGQGPIKSKKLLSFKKVVAFFKSEYPKVLNISFTLNQKTDHSISAAAYTENFALVGRISAVSNHTDLEDALSYTYHQNPDGSSVFKKNEIFINLTILDKKFKDVKFILIIIVSPSYEILKGKMPITHISDADSFSTIIDFQPDVEDYQSAWMPLVFCKNEKGSFDVVTISKFFRSPKPFEAQILMKNFLRNENIMQEYLK